MAVCICNSSTVGSGGSLGLLATSPGPGSVRNQSQRNKAECYRAGHPYPPQTSAHMCIAIGTYAHMACTVISSIDTHDCVLHRLGN